MMLLLLLCAVGVFGEGSVGPRRAVDPALDCSLRAIAYGFGQHLLPDPDSQQLIFDALRLGAECGMNASSLLPVSAKPAASPHLVSLPASTPATTLFVSPTGSDSSNGQLASPFATLQHAVDVARASPPPVQIYLRGGTYFLGATVVLTPADSGLAISAYNAEMPVLSGGQPLPPGLTWSLYKDLPSGGMTGPYPDLSVVSDAPGLTPGGNATGIVYAGDFDAAADCLAACGAASICTSYTYHDATVTAGWARQCFFRTDGLYSPDTQTPGHFAGNKAPGQNASIWRAALPAAAFDNLYSATTGRRLTRARAPNGNPEETTAGFVGGALAWLPPHAYPDPTEVHIASPSRADDPFFPTYQLGLGGTCAIFSPASGFWCTKSPPAGSQFNVPSGVQLPQGLLGDWENASGAIFHAFHGARWGDWKFRVASGNSSGGLLQWSEGGFQEARGWATGDTFMIENLLELHDQHDEWYLDSAAGVLYVAVNASAPAPSVSPPALISTHLDSLLRLEGTPDEPVTGITLSGLTFAHTAPTFMKPYAMASGGDWSVRVDGALFLEGTAGVGVSNCSFTGLGGNAVFLSGWNRGATVQGCRFRYVGDSAIVSLGKVQGIDGTAQEVPVGTRVLGNIATEFGLYTKQSGFYYQALTANATVVGNVAANMPRASVNFNDGYAGGHNVSYNLFFNCVRESSDHGCFNSWDRQPYAWDPTNPATLYPLQTLISRNLVVNNYGGRWALDHDDGSNAFLDAYNLQYWGGGKNYLGFNKHYVGNLYLYPESSQPTASLGNGYPQCYGSAGGAALPGRLRDSWVNETCYTTSGGAGVYSFGCNPASVADGQAPALANNSLFTGDGSYELDCGGQHWDLPTAQAYGLDLGSSVGVTPSSEAVLQAVREFVQEYLVVAV